MEEASSIVFIGETIQRDILLFIVERRSFRWKSFWAWSSSH